MDRRAIPNSKVLMITYVFPPAAWVGAHRTLKYCKYLGAYGWTPVVLTAKPIGVTFVDENLLRQLPSDVVVHRTFDVDPAKWEDKLTARKIRRSKSVAAPLAAEHAPVAARPVSERSGLFHRVKQLIKSVLKESPDPHVFWVPFAFLRGVAILLTEKVDVIYCTTPPHSSHFVAYLLAKCFRLPYVLDFRDPWYVNGSAISPVYKVRALLELETWAKQRIIRGAAKIICVSKGELDELRAEFPRLHAGRFTCITNGYDPADLPENGTVAERSARLSLIHAGTIYQGIAGEFFDALRQLLADDPAIGQSIEVQLLGEIAYEYDAAVRTLESAGIVKVHGLQPHARTLQLVHRSDVLVILLGGTRFLPSHLPSKVFEYLHAGKPILAIAAEGELTEIVKQSGLGIVVPPQSVDGVVEALRNLVADHAAGRLTSVPNQSFIRSFERAALAEKLARVLDEVREAELVRQ